MSLQPTPRARRGWRKRLSILAFLSLLLALPLGLAAQTPALASISINAFAGTGTAGFSGDGGAATSAQLNGPTGVATDGAGNVFIFDNLNKRVREVSGGTIHTVAGNGNNCSSSGFTDAFEPDNPGVCSGHGYAITDPGFTVSPSGNIFFNNSGWLDMTPAGAPYGYHFDGKTTGLYSPGDGSQFSVSVAPYSMADYHNVLPENSGGGPFGTGLVGGVFFAEASTSGYPGNSIKLDSGGIGTIAGKTGTSTCTGYPTDGQAAVGACIHPQDMAVWSHYLYFFDSSPGYQGPEIFRIDLSATPGSRTLQKIAGNGSWSYSGSDGSAAVNDGIGHVGPLAVDSSGSVYFGSDSGGAVRKVDTSGNLWHVTDVGAAQAGYAFDAANNLYISLPSNNKVVQVAGLGSPLPGAGKNLFALGDSVAAGEGINYGYVYHQTTGGPDWHTNTSSVTWAGDSSQVTQQCHRSVYGYPYVVAAQDGYSLSDLACTGASTTNGLITGQTEPNWTQSETAQIDAAYSDPNHLPDVITLTVGMDDIPFNTYLSQCYQPLDGDCQNDVLADGNTMDHDVSTAITVYQTNLDEVLQEIQGKGQYYNHMPKVYITSYYDPFGSYTNQYTCRDVVPVGWGNGGVIAGLDDNEIVWIKQKLSDINSEIQTEANLYPSFVTFVDIANVMSGNQFCSSDPWAYGASIVAPFSYGGNGDTNSPAPFHPTPEGQYAIANAVMNAIGS